MLIAFNQVLYHLLYIACPALYLLEEALNLWNTLLVNLDIMMNDPLLSLSNIEQVLCCQV
jgi:hypothetical protein